MSEMDILEHLRSKGYADGGYENNCIDCNESFLGDKRAIRCYECAMKLIKPPKPMTNTTDR